MLPHISFNNSFRNLTLRWLMASFILILGGFVLWNNLNKPRILILHSYDAKNPWSNEVSVGLNRILSKHSYWTIRWYYMDTLAGTHDPENIGRIARRMVEQWKPDVIVAIDDDAQALVTKHLANHPTIKMIFCGVRMPPETYGFDKAKNVTGILQRPPLRSVRELLLNHARMAGYTEPPRITLVNVDSPVGRSDERVGKLYGWHPLTLVQSRLVTTLEDFKSAIIAAQTDSDAIIISAYDTIVRSATDKTIVPPSEVLKQAELLTSIPIIGTGPFFAENGGMFAIGPSGYEQGEVAGRMVELVMSGKKPAEIPIVLNQEFAVGVRASLIERHQFQVPTVYEAAAKTAGKYYRN